ncbi:MAG: hypothetical protein L0271_14230, partial [Gemmatimonadetes bacterium]|nr:hypothetical protein [Gemmatimonadota bacterium]
MSRRTPGNRFDDDVPADRSAEWKAERPLHRRRIYLLLAAIALSATAASIFLRRVDWIDRFGPNFATEVLGILITLVFVHRFLEQQDRARRLRGSIGALRKASRALTRMADAWGAVVKGSLRRMPAERPSSLETLFTPFVTETLVELDPSALRPSEDGGDPVRWTTWTANELAAAQLQLHQIIVTYATSLDPAYIEAIDELVDDPFLRLFAGLAIQPPDARAWRVRLNTGRALREAHFDRLLHAVALHNRIAADAA